MPFVQRVIEPKYLSRTSLWDGQGKPKVDDGELEAVTNNTLSNALRQLASLVLVAEDIFSDLGGQLQAITKRSEKLKVRIQVVEEKVSTYDPKKVTVPESDICTFALLKEHYVAKQIPDSNLFTAGTRPRALQDLYEAATKTPIHLMRQLDRWRRDGHRSSRFFMCTPVLGQKRRRIRNRVDIDIETRMPAAVKDLRRWTSSEALGDITVLPDCPNRILPNATVTDGETTDGTIASDDEGIDHKLPSPEEQLQVIALKFPAEIVAVDVSGRSFDRMSVQRRSLLHGDTSAQAEDEVKRRSRTRRPRNRRRNTLAGTDQKEIRTALGAGEEPCSSANNETEPAGAVSRSKSSDILRSSSTSKKETSPKSHFNTLKQWGRNRYDWFKNKTTVEAKKEDVDDFNIYETVRRRRSSEKRSHERNPSISSSEKSSSVNLPVSPLSSVMNIAVKLRESSVQRRQRRNGNKDEPHSSSGNWSASSESGRASVASETTTHPKSSATSSNSLNQAPNSINSRRRFVNTSASSSITSEGTLTPDIIHDLHEDGDSVYSCDTEGYYTSFHMDSGLKTLKEEELPPTPLHYTSAFSNSSSNNTVLTAENEYELFGKGSTSTTTSSAGTVCTTLRASDRSLAGCPAVPERKSSLNKYSPESSLERSSDKTGTVKRSPASSKANRESKENVKQSDDGKEAGNVSGDVSPDSGHNTSSSPIESICSPNGIRSGSEFEFSESSDMEGPERIERIRVKTTINSSRIPSMCVITPPHSDDESVQSYNNDCYKNSKLHLDLKPNQDEVDVLKSSDSDKENMNIIQKRVIRTNGAVINVNTETGYATVEAAKRAPSPSGGSMTVRDVPKKSPSQPIIKATLLPLFGKLKSNFANLKRRESKSPNRIQDDQATVSDEGISSEAGDYVTLADVRNNNEKPKTRDLVYANVGRTPVVAMKEKTEYVSLDELPCNEAQNKADSLERRKRQGARVTLDAEGKVVYSSDSLKRKKGHTTFEPGPFVKDTPSPLPIHRVPKTIRPVNPASPHLGKLVIRAASGTSNPEVVRIPPSIVSPNVRAMSPPRGAYVHIQDAGKLSSPTLDKERVPSPPNYPAYPESQSREMYNYRVMDENMDRRGYLESQYYLQKGGSMYQTLPSKKSQFIYADIKPERSVTPDITRGLEHNYMDRNFAMPMPMPMVDRRYTYNDPNPLKLGIPVQIPDVSSFRIQHKVPSCYTPTKDRPTYSSYISPHDNKDDFRISPIDPRNSGGFQSSTPSSSKPPPDSKATVNLENILSPKKSTMSNEELYAVIHKSKKKMNIETDDNRASPIGFDAAKSNSPETGYIGDKSRSRLSWSPTKGEYIDFNTDIDKLSPPTESRSRQSWACSDRKGTCQTSRMDFKKLLLQKSTVLSPVTKKLSAVEQLKLSRQQIQTQKPHQQSALNILELSGSPRSLTKKFNNNPPAPGSPRNTGGGEKPKPAPKLMSPRSQWRFTNPRSDVLSSTILEDCREDESPNSSIEKKKSPAKSGSVLQGQDVNDIVKGSVANRKSLFESKSTKECPSQPYSSISEKLQARRAQFFQTNPSTSPNSTSGDKSPPTLETAF